MNKKEFLKKVWFYKYFEGATTFSITTFSIMTLSMMAYSIIIKKTRDSA